MNKGRAHKLLSRAERREKSLLRELSMGNMEVSEIFRETPDVFQHVENDKTQFRKYLKSETLNQEYYHTLEQETQTKN